ncbi:caspase family protein [Nonomuraea sp. NPDC049607]|uniref:caspase, EACC1-associated type n=1 Tax=Nonomuraea sp. NPDC049607 TaxID=3154732 RepID=UPI0034269B0A
MLARPGARVLVVGSGAYVAQSRLRAVPAVERTVVDLGRHLTERTGLDPAHLTTLVNPRDPQEFGSALVDVVEQADDVLVFYYVGHGLISPRGELHLGTFSTVDLTQGIASHQALPYSTVSDVLSECRAQLVLIVLDCCFSGRAQTVIQPGIDQVFAASRHGSYVLAAAGRDEAAWALEGERHTIFSGALIDLLAGGDPAAGPYLTLDDVHRSLSRRLSERGLPAPRRQATGFGDRQRLAVNSAHSGESGEQVGEISPYLGLTSFGPQDAEVFFGRSELTAQLVDRVAGQLTCREFLMVVGPSGAGKSSLLRAGLMPALEHAPGTSVMVFTPGQDPVSTLGDRFAALAGSSPGELRETLLADPGRLRELLDGSGERVLIVDQFEEIFTQCKDESQRCAFLAVLHAACSVAAVVISVRADFFGTCVGYPELAAGLDRPVVVTPMTVAQLRMAIEEPARVAGLTVQPALVDLLLEDIGVDLGISGSSSVLPLLSHALLATWQRREGGVLTVSGYRAAGGVSQALAKTADATLAALDLPGQRAIRQLLPRLVGLGESTDDTRIRIPLDDLLPIADDRDDTWQALDRFVRARLLTVDANTIEISHEALIRAWPRLREWINVNRATLLARQQLDRQARHWADHEEDPSYLYSGNRLAAAQEARTQWEADPAGFPPLSERSARFLRTSVAARERAKRARKWGIGIVAASLAVALLASIGITVNARSTADEAERQRLAAISQKVATQSVEAADTDPELSRLLAAAAFSLSGTSAARYGLARAWADPRRRVLSTVVIAVYTLTMGQFGGKPAIIAGGGYSDSGRGKLVIWDATDGRQMQVMDAASAVVSVVMGQFNGQPAIISASSSGKVEIWDAVSGQRLQVLNAADSLSAVTMGQFDGEPAIISASSSGEKGGTIEIWDTDGGRRLLAINTGGWLSTVTTGQFNGKPAIISGRNSEDGQLEIWDAVSGQRLHAIDTAGGMASVTTGQLNGAPVIITGSGDTIEVWDANGGRRLRAMTTADSVSSVSLGQFNGRPVLISGGGERNVHEKSERLLEIWDAVSGQRLQVMDATGSLSAVTMGQFGGKLAIISGSDGWDRGDVEIWDAVSGQRLHAMDTMDADGALAGVTMGEFDGQPVIITGTGGSVSSAGGVEVWDTVSGQRLHTMATAGAVFAVAMGQFGGKPAIISGGVRHNDENNGYTGRVEVWDANGGRRLHAMDATGWVSAVAFGQFAGKPVIISSTDSFVDGVGRVEIWDAADGQRLHAMNAAGAVASVAMGQFNGKPVIISGGDDGSGGGTVEVWDAASGQSLHAMDLAGAVHSVAMGQFGGRPAIISGGVRPSGTTYTGRIEIWDANGGRQLHAMDATGSVSAVAAGQFNGNPAIISSGGDGSGRGKIEIWDAGDGQRVHQIDAAHWVSAVTGGQFNGQPVILTGSGDLLQVWLPSLPADLLGGVCAQASRPLTSEEWVEHVGPDDAFRQVCPGRTIARP